MEKFIPIEKMSKKARRRFYLAQRKDWGGLCPVTRKPKNPKAYDRTKARRKDHSFDAGPWFFAH